MGSRKVREGVSEEVTFELRLQSQEGSPPWEEVKEVTIWAEETPNL